MGEEWRSIKNYPRYLVNREGQIKNHRFQQYLHPFSDDRGYLKVTMINEEGKKNVKVAKLVAEAFLAGRGDEVRYKDNNRTNVRADNLYWFIKNKRET